MMLDSFIQNLIKVANKYILNIIKNHKERKEKSNNMIKNRKVVKVVKEDLLLVNQEPEGNNQKNLWKEKESNLTLAKDQTVMKNNLSQVLLKEKNSRKNIIEIHLWMTKKL